MVGLVIATVAVVAAVANAVVMAAETVVEMLIVAAYPPVHSPK